MGDTSTVMYGGHYCCRGGKKRFEDATHEEINIRSQTMSCPGCVSSICSAHIRNNDFVTCVTPQCSSSSVLTCWSRFYSIKHPITISLILGKQGVLQSLCLLVSHQKWVCLQFHMCKYCCLEERPLYSPHTNLLIHFADLCCSRWTSETNWVWILPSI